MSSAPFDKSLPESLFIHADHICDGRTTATTYPFPDGTKYVLAAPSTVDATGATPRWSQTYDTSKQTVESIFADFAAMSILARQLEADLAAREREACTFEKRTTCSFASSAIKENNMKDEVTLQFSDGCLWLDWREGLINLTNLVGRDNLGARKDMTKVMERLAPTDGTAKP